MPTQICTRNKYTYTTVIKLHLGYDCIHPLKLPHVTMYLDCMCSEEVVHDFKLAP